MKVAKTLVFGSIASAVVTFYPQITIADGFDNKGFLSLENAQKKFWIDGAIDTLGHVAAIKSKEQGQCVYDWYYNDTANKNGLILASMTKYPDHTPSAILIALTERACEKYVRE